MVTYGRRCELCSTEVTLDFGDSDEVKKPAISIVTYNASFDLVSSKLDELMKLHLNVCHQQFIPNKP